MSQRYAQLALALMLPCLPVGMAMAAPGNCNALGQLPAVVEVGEGLQTELQSPVAITRLAIGDPKIADVRVNGDRNFLLTGVGSGATSLMVWTGCSTTPRQSMVFVKGKATSALTSQSLSPSEDPTLPSQVQTDIRFVEVSRTKLKEASTKILGMGKNFFLGSPDLLSPAEGIFKLPVSADSFNIGFGGGRVKALINALESSGFAYTLARPSLVAMSGQSATFLAGGEVPIPVPSAGSDTISIEYKEFGIRLTLTPTVIDHNRIALKVAPEVSELDYNNSIQIEGIQVPALTVRRTDTSVSLADGESFVISGLISSTNRSTIAKLPGLGDIPIIGAFFRDSNIRSEEKELLMIVTPHLVRPLAANAQLPSLPGEKLRNYDPNWFRLFFLENGNFDRRNGLSQ
ncbi:type II and III secretion system protein family protein [Pseudomonas haemolytica]|uniref:Type II and III secretion system protein family protein n=1 Tax=Pseudomonas haemolytica TaxID=2600065 RepID=A0A5P1DER4_9PSED|nr:type II and III secretion system protein family protein [Pseudomonas haemolytica]MBJ2246036.1 type II and III secretion system protein family protein [Pseudomonas haemolytica]MBJ2273732.1 type II and III secretion system protein family protein [Pseudomonas haemolytica]MBK3448692.1 type II and III secretion system protein family protein [Pseudomonas haemolytica]MBK3460946.1 type II and III secretion system protein family protein [Pseudomonas haemolytica]MRJ38129.1 type II and III secretion s